MLTTLFGEVKVKRKGEGKGTTEGKGIGKGKGTVKVEVKGIETGTLGGRNLQYCHPLYNIVPPFWSNTQNVLEGSGEYCNCHPIMKARLTLNVFEERVECQIAQ